jgi:hypothetical protein
VNRVSGQSVDGRHTENRSEPRRDMGQGDGWRSCVYPNNGFSIFFQEDSGKFNLMEQPPSGIFLNLDTYCVAVSPAKSVSVESAVPSHVTIVDAQGEHRVYVAPWK